MPTYVYLCSSCGTFELFQGMKDSALEKCPKCGSPVKRQISGGAGFIFKGSGFYTTDYRSGEYTKREKEEKAASSPKVPTATETGTKAADRAPADRNPADKGPADKGPADTSAVTGKTEAGTPPAGGTPGSSAPAVGGGQEAPKPAPPTPGS